MAKLVLWWCARHYLCIKNSWKCETNAFSNAIAPPELFELDSIAARSGMCSTHFTFQLVFTVEFYSTRKMHFIGGAKQSVMKPFLFGRIVIFQSSCQRIWHWYWYLMVRWSEISTAISFPNYFRGNQICWSTRSNDSIQLLCQHLHWSRAPKTQCHTIVSCIWRVIQFRAAPISILWNACVFGYRFRTPDVATNIES